MSDQSHLTETERRLGVILGVEEALGRMLKSVAALREILAGDPDADPKGADSEFDAVLQTVINEASRIPTVISSATALRKNFIVTTDCPRCGYRFSTQYLNMDA